MSLLKPIKEEIKQKYPKVHKVNTDFISNSKAKIFSASFKRILVGYAFLILIVIIYSKYLNFELLQVLTVKFEENTKTFITGIITLVSINLFVTNFLFTHLKEERDDIQFIIDEKVNFKFITYFGFSIVIYILLLYFLSPTFSDITVKSNILIFIFCSFIVYILLLIALYNTVFKFIHREERNRIIQKELNNEFYRSFYFFYIKRSFKTRYRDFFEKELNFVPEYQFRFGENKNKNRVILKSRNSGYLKDIKSTKIKKKLSSLKPNENHFYPLEFDMKLDKLKPYYILALKKDIDFKARNFYVISKQSFFGKKSSQNNLNILLNKINDNTLNNQFKNLESNLKNLDEIYENYLDLER